MREFYVYLHCLPNGRPFYIGKGFGNRAFTLWKTRNRHYKFIIQKYGIENIKVIVLPCESEPAAFSYEIQLIKAFRGMGYKLANKTNGGEGPVGAIRSKETRAKMALAKIGNKHTLGLKRGIMPLSQREKISATRKQRKIPTWNKGIPHPQEVRDKISATKRARIEALHVA